MIKLENTEVVGWEAAIRGMRNPLNSWTKSDSTFETDVESCSDCPYFKECNNRNYDTRLHCINIGENDHSLMMKLSKAGTDHRKFMRMITVYVDVTAPLYLWAELDTYKVGTVRNSCSFMHKGVSKPFEITDFNLKDERIYEILSPLTKKTYELTYPYETDEYRNYTDYNGRNYRVYRNGLVIRESFDYVDNYGTGRKRHFDDKEATLWQNGNGYFVIKLSGRNGGSILLHRLVAEVWCEKREGANQVNHIDGDKGNNSAENLEWVTASENMKHGVETGLYDELKGLHRRYRIWKNGIDILPIHKRYEFKIDVIKGLTNKELAEKWDITPSQATNIKYSLNHSDNEDLYQECYIWDEILEELNYLRGLYLEIKDDKIFQSIRCLLPQGYLQRSTLMLNYEVLANIYKSRKNHKLDEWRDFCKWIESLPYSELITTPSQRSEDMVYACRCKNCESYISWEDMRNDEAFEDYRNDCNHDGICMNLNCWTNEEDFCSHGKRC